MRIKNMVRLLRTLATHPVFITAVFTMGFIGIYYSRAMVSLYGVGIFLVGLISFLGKSDWKRVLWNRHTIPFILVFVVYMLSALMSDNLSHGLSRLKTNNYFLTIPLGIALLQPFSKSFIQRLLLIYAGVSAITALIVTGDYFLNYTLYSEAYKIGQTMATPIIHIQYSFYISLAALVAGSLLLEKVFSDWKKWLCLGIFTFLFLFLHLLAVRTGLVSLYAGLVLFAIVKGRHYIRPLYMAGIGVLLCLGLYSAVHVVPSLKNKMQYMQHDLKLFLSGEGHHLYSDNLRLISISNGLVLLNQHPMFGTGIGDLDQDSRNLYTSLYPDVPEPLQSPPISQYFYSLSAFGYVGGFLFFAFLFYPLFYRNQWQDNRLLLIYGATLGSFVGDYSIELQLGKVVFVSLVSLSLWYVTPLDSMAIETRQVKAD